MAKPELEFHVPNARWQQPPGAPSGIWDRELSRDSGTGESTSLQRYDPGAESAPGIIMHEYWEEVVLLEGDLHDATLNQTFTAGMYACRPPGMPHGPYRSVAGCLMLVITRYSRISDTE